MMRAWVLVVLVVGGCNGKNKDGALEFCEKASDCTDIPDEAEAECLGKGDAGYCTWTCSVDGDCEDDTLVCSAFSNEAEKFCFPSCEKEDANAGICPQRFSCASTGGGSENRKVCFPEDV